MRIFVISLEGHRRREKMTMSLAALGIDFEFFDAVDGSNLTTQHKNLIDIEGTLKNIPSGMSDTEYACALSHALLYKKIVSEEIDNAIILEDDVFVTAGLKEMIDAHVLDRSKFDLVMLCYLNAWSKKYSFKSFFKMYRSFALWNVPLRTAGYYINQKAAGNLNKAAIPISSTADWPLGAFEELSAVCITPQIVVHPCLLEEESTLEHERKARRLAYKASRRSESFLSKYKRKILFLFFVPKNNNEKLPRFWLNLLGSKVIGQ